MDLHISAKKFFMIIFMTKGKIDTVKWLMFQMSFTFTYRTC